MVYEHKQERPQNKTKLSENKFFSVEHLQHTFNTQIFHLLPPNTTIKPHALGLNVHLMIKSSMSIMEINQS